MICTHIKGRLYVELFLHDMTADAQRFCGKVGLKKCRFSKDAFRSYTHCNFDRAVVAKVTVLGNTTIIKDITKE